MGRKSILYALIFLFVGSAAMLTPVVLPYFTLETSSPEAPSLTNTESLQNFAKALGDQSKRNMDRLKTSLFFAKWFVLSFAVFVTSGLGLFALLVLKLFQPLKLNTIKSEVRPHK